MEEGEKKKKSGLTHREGRPLELREDRRVCLVPCN